MKRFLQILFLFFVSLSISEASNHNKFLPVVDLSSPLNREAIDERNLKIHELDLREEVEQWKRSEKERLGKIEEWKADRILEASKKFTPLKGGVLFEKDFGKWGIKIGTWGQKDGWYFLKIEW